LALAVIGFKMTNHALGTGICIKIAQAYRSGSKIVRQPLGKRQVNKIATWPPTKLKRRYHMIKRRLRASLHMLGQKRRCPASSRGRL
jgi:hypothetical protein